MALLSAAGASTVYKVAKPSIRGCVSSLITTHDVALTGAAQDYQQFM